MGGKNPTKISDNRRARMRIATQSMKGFMEARAAAERIPLQNEERICKKCGFKARYPFIRCPECNTEGK